MKKWKVLCVIAVCAIIAVCALGCSSDYSDAVIPSDFAQDLASVDAPKEGDVRIMSANLLAQMWAGGDTLPTKVRAKMFASVLERFQPDVAGLQEAEGEWHRYLTNVEDTYEMIYPKGDWFTLNYSPLIYNKNTLNLIESGHFFYSVNESNNKNCRAVTWGVFEIKASGKKFAASSTHLDLIRGNDTEKEFVRMETQVDEITAKVLELAQTYDCPVFATGDYNAQDDFRSLASDGQLAPLSDSSAFRIYLRLTGTDKDGNAMQRRLYDSKTLIDPERIFYDKASSEYGAFDPTWDHIFLPSEECATVRSFYVPNFKSFEQMSDHDPIFADFSF